MLKLSINLEWTHLYLSCLVIVNRGQDSMAPNFIQNITHCRSVTMNLHGSTILLIVDPLQWIIMKPL